MDTKEKISRIFFFISLTITILGFGFFLWGALDLMITGNPEEAGHGIGKALLISILIIYGSIGFGICTIFNIISFILQKVSNTSKTWNIVTGISILLPAVLEGISLLLLSVA